MIPSPDRNTNESLINLYSKFVDNLQRQRVKLRKNSVFLTITAVSPNIQSKISGILEQSSFLSHLFPMDELRRLVDGGLVRHSAIDVKSFVITAKGIWFIEKEKEVITKQRFVDFVESEILVDKEIGRKLSDREKTILFSLLCLRCFSADSCMDINDRDHEDQWLEVFNDCQSFLYSNGLIKAIGVFKGKGLEHPVSAEMRRANKLQKKTRFIYQYSGRRQYFLKISKEEERALVELVSLHYLILDAEIDPDLLHGIESFCNDLAYERTKYVKDLTFLSRQYDRLLQKTITSIMLDGSPIL